MLGLSIEKCRAKGVPGLRTEWGLTAGVTHPFAKFHTEIPTAELKAKTGITVGLHMALRIGGVFAVQPEINFSHFKINIQDKAASFTSEIKSNTLQIPVLASVKLGFLRLNAGPVFTLMDNPTYLDRNNEKVMFGRIYPTITYAVGVSLLLVKHLYIDARFMSRFNSTENFLSYDAEMEGVDFKTNMHTLQIKIGYVF